ncbi:MAG TPA: ribonuclease HII [Candidatus Thermoplasmatota archaeon]|nr:ribonuclease HII [Candidatus Thermoplasmatota archaeon]
MLAGADEAGRGPVLGPLVVAAVAARSPAHLARLGACDSKLLSPDKREQVATRIRAYARCEVRVVSAAELNAGMRTRTLNQIEVDAFAEVLARLAPSRAVVDACDPVADRFADHIMRRLPPPPCEVRARHGADRSHAIVGAASIVAKVTRDAIVRDIEREIGEPIGSGYPHDPRTRAFLQRWRQEHDDLPPHTRLYWATVAGDRPLDRRLEKYL